MKKYIDIESYPYGRKTQSLKSAVKQLNKFLQKKENRESLKDEDGYVFWDYPEYPGLDKRTTRYLGTDEVDFIQDQLNETIS